MMIECLSWKHNLIDICIQIIRWFIFEIFFLSNCIHLEIVYCHLWSVGNDHHLTHSGRVTHICVSNLTIIGSDNGLSPGRRQAIIWTNAGILITGPLGTNFSEILIEIYIFSFKKMHLKMSYGKWWPFCLSLNVLKYVRDVTWTLWSFKSLVTELCLGIKDPHYRQWVIKSTGDCWIPLTKRQCYGNHFHVITSS